MTTDPHLSENLDSVRHALDIPRERDQSDEVSSSLKFDVVNDAIRAAKAFCPFEKLTRRFCRGGSTSTWTPSSL